MGGTYTQVGDYYLPDLKLPEEETQANIGVWGMRHKRFLKENHRVLYANLITSGKLVAYLDDIEQQATAMFLRLVKELAEKENVTEELKATEKNAALEQKVRSLLPLKEALRKAENELGNLKAKYQNVLKFIEGLKLTEKLEEYLRRTLRSIKR